MQLTQHTDFALRLLIVLARAGGGPVPLTGFATQQNLSYNHVAKVAQGLAREGFIVSHRGRSGGVSLARPASEIAVGDVVRRMEKGMRIADCAHCALKGDCAMSPLLAKALAAFLAVLDGATLAEAAEPGVAHALWAFAPAA